MGYRVSARDADQLAAIATELGTLRAGRRTLDEVLPAMREVVGTETLVVLSPVLRGPMWQLERLHLDGFSVPAAMVERIELFFRRAPERYAWYDATRPEPAQRNKLIEAHTIIAPGELEESPIYNLWLYPERLHRHRQPRVLLCDDATLLAWFGAFHDGPVEPRHWAMLRRLVEPVRRRLRLERQLDSTTGYDGALEVALDQLGPALIVDRTGAIGYANQAARVLLATDAAGLDAALCAALAGVPGSGIELTAIADRAWLAIVRPSRDERIRASVQAAAVRWSLSRRQQAVLHEVVRGNSNVTIALHLGVSERAVELHVSAILARAEVANRSALVAAVLLLDPSSSGREHDGDERGAAVDTGTIEQRRDV